MPARLVRIPLALAFAAVVAVGAIISAGTRLGDDGGSVPAAIAGGARDIPMLRAASLAVLNGGRGASPGEIVAAKEMLAKRPASQLALLLLGLDAGRRGDPRATPLIDAALRRDPRSLEALTWKMIQAAKANRIGEATELVIRLMVLVQNDDRYMSTLALLASDPAGQAVIERALRSSGSWRAVFLDHVASSELAPALIYRLFRIGRSAEIDISKQEESFLLAQVDRGEWAQAHAAWRGWLPAGARDADALVYNGSFKSMPGLRPFNWTLTTNGDGAASFAAHGGLDVRASGRLATNLAKQLVVLPPGSYRIITSFTQEPTGGNSLDQPVLHWRLTCQGASNALADLPLPEQRTPGKLASAPFTVPASCGAQWLTLDGSVLDFPFDVTGRINALAIERLP